MEAVERMISKQSEEMCQNFRNDLTTELDERNIGGVDYGVKKINEEVKALLMDLQNSEKSKQETLPESLFDECDGFNVDFGVDADVDEPLAVPTAAVPPVDTTVTGNATVNIQRQQQKMTFHLDWIGRTVKMERSYSCLRTTSFPSLRLKI